MNRKHATWAGLVAAMVVGAGAATPALAHGDDLNWSVTIGSSPVRVMPPAVMAPPAMLPAPVVAAPGWRAPRPAPAWRGAAWDRDHDGIPDRRDPVFNPRWDRDGDGIPNSRDRHPNHPDHPDRRWR